MTDKELLQQALRALAWCSRNTVYADPDGTITALRERLAREEPVARQEQHPDDMAVDRFAAAMRAKMAKQRAKGYGGWDDKADCPVEILQERLVKHVAKGDPVDVGNFAMMLFNRGEPSAMPVRQEQCHKRRNEPCQCARGAALCDGFGPEPGRQEPICDGCGGTIAQHTNLLHCTPARQEPVANLTVEDGRVAVAAKLLPDGIYDLYTAPQPVIPEGYARAVHEAVTAIYLDDNSDYLPALWSVVKALAPDLAKLLDSNPSAAWHQSEARLAAAQKEMK